MRLFRLVGTCFFYLLVFISPASAQFTEIGGLVGLDLGGNKDGGIAWGDFNSDGCPDLLVNTDNNSIRTRIFLSSCNLVSGPTFTDVTSTYAAGLLNATTERSAIWADFNNDGYLDFARNTHNRFEVYANKGPSATPAYSFGTNIQGPNLVITGVSGGMNVEGFGWLDYNGDGWLDLILENHNYGIDIFENPADGSANFFHVTPNGATKGLPTGASTGDYMCLSDYNNDGYVDILARKENEFDLWQNNGPLGTTQFQANIGFNENANNGNKGGVLFADFNNDGFFDLFWSDRGSNTIYLGDGAGNFSTTTEPATSAGVTLPSNGIDGCAAADVNNDGKIDLFLSDRSGASWLFINNMPYGGALSFTRNNLGIDVDEDGEGSAFADYDLDGDMDLYLNISNSANQLWMNGNNNENFLFVRALRDLGSGVERDDIGATVVLKDCDGNVRSGIRDVNGTRGHGAQDAPKIHFGLPDGNAAVYVVEVSFTYVNGTRTVLQQAVIPNLEPSQTLRMANTGVSDLSLCQTLSASGIIAFSANGDQDAVDLKWQIDEAESGSRYEVERSENGIDFERIGQVYGTQGGETTFGFSDMEPQVGTGFYRIYRNQDNGETSYSSILTFNIESKAGLTLTPNPVPAGEEMGMIINSVEGGDHEVQVFDVRGKLVKVSNILLAPGANRISIDRAKLEPGVYFLKVSGPGFEASERILLR